MEFQTFPYAYIGKLADPSMSNLAHMDPTETFREVERTINESKVSRDEEALEPEHQLSILYRGDNDFKIKGRSYALFRLFAQNLVQWFWAPDGDPFECGEVNYLKRLFEQLNDQIELETLEFDTDVTWSIKTSKDSDSFTIKVSTRLWSGKMELLKY